LTDVASWPEQADSEREMGLNLLRSGFNSTSLFTLNRRLDQRRLVLLDLGLLCGGLLLRR